MVQLFCAPSGACGSVSLKVTGASGFILFHAQSITSSIRPRLVTPSLQLAQSICWMGRSLGLSGLSGLYEYELGRGALSLLISMSLRITRRFPSIGFQYRFVAPMLVGKTFIAEPSVLTKPKLWCPNVWSYKSRDIHFPSVDGCHELTNQGSFFLPMGKIR